MKSYSESQCVIISGESGAGKTEAAKRIMQYIASVSGGSASSDIQRIKDMVLATNPLLESFGCAKTLRNDNSSRHGKYLEILFNGQGEPVGAQITNYLLEKARVVGQIRNERNFHIFYQFTKGATQQYREVYGIQGPETYLYTSASKCTSVDSIDDVKDFQETINAMKVIGLTQDEQDSVFRLLAAILWIGNIDFIENDEGSQIRDSSVPNFVAYLLDVDAASIEKALTIRIVETSRGGRRGSVYESPLNVVQAKAVRDALAKAIYDKLFDWIVYRVNESLKAQKGSSSLSIGILDIYGFEIFENNSFEQICINYVNEKLQQIFIQLTLKSEQEEYVREQISWTPIDYFNNKVVCDLIEERRPPGIFSVLNDAVATAHADSGAADQNFAMKLSMLSSNAHFEQRQNKFLIKHYAGDVMYDINGMTDKNKDQLLKDLLVLIDGSSNQFLKQLFPDQVDTDSRKRPPTASDKIKKSANALMDTLAQAQPSYIRTIKPNQHRSPSEYDEKAVLHQVKYLGLKENVRIRRAGFAYRQTFDKFVERFYLLSRKTSYAGDFIWQGDSRSATIQIFKDTGIPASEYQMGVTKAFIKTPETLFALEHMRDMYWHNMAARIQRAWRRHQKFKADCATKIQRAWREAKGSKKYIELRERGHAVLKNQKERRRMSLLGYRRFWGDYLACNVKNSPGGFMMKAIGVTDTVRFSCRGEILFAKFGRSSQRLDRVFILTAGKFFVVAESVIQNQLSFVVEHTYAASSIRSVSMTNLRDDWFALNTGSSSEPEPLLWCYFKTELVTLLNVPVKIGPTIQYNKKPGKPSTVKSQRDETAPPNYDAYKSGTIRVRTGQPANSVSEPIPKPKPKVKSATTTRSTPAAKPKTRRPPPRAPTVTALPSQAAAGVPPPRAANTYSYPSSTPAAASSIPAGPAVTAQPASMTNNTLGSGPGAAAAAAAAAAMSHTTSSARQAPVKATPSPAVPAQRTSPAAKRVSRVPPPPPVASSKPSPPPPAPPAQPTAKALYDYAGTRPNELSISKDEIVYVLQKADNGWWLAEKLDKSAQGWTPASYVEEIKVESAPPAAARKAPPPAPPKKKAIGSALTPNGGAATPSSDQTPSPTLASGLAEALKQKNQATNHLAGGLADALKARAGRHESEDEGDDDW
ncbi:myosin 5 [Sugiyamaella lignohabitans]|uniref:Myosin 5 n=1 Tax=Sugiyamaella lignohabitans TaxID=796027 RepID=A0A167EFC6_9ASCO|nr:myosin 5 [Sugiyamaella lignohabitans]ANB14006.1 myosin 5 [Sugiyamaella lignohabitans]